ncbi:predicted protein [Naegleria gruberi]|uniref:Predicted protein n=1 Tax=Naegleria gruberi TaxID=5762 RepID=D2VSF1_NAEGR|nr:uncharacterized protein NAEGRDRAFT_71918 [Naegleria gruberi]EFC40108.1 predicted protein [Naegleria gruberi]|eukprot:XP_002672852.1 predicted protein [Naegleria gruberi strain NEG-M]
MSKLRIILAVVLVCMVAACCIAETTESGEWKVKLRNEDCKREMKFSLSDSNKVAEIESTGGCKSKDPEGLIQGSIANIEFQFNVKKVPLVRMKAHTAVKVDNGPTKVVNMGGLFGFERLFEYINNDGKDGYQVNGTDTIVRSIDLSTVSWSQITVQKTVLNGSSNSFIYEASSQATIANWCTFKMSAVVSTSEVQVTSNKTLSRSGVIQVLTPSSLKVNVELTNIQYTAGNSLLGISSITAYRGNLKEKPTQDKPVEEKPDDASPDQAVNQFDGDVTDQTGSSAVVLPKAFFSFQTFVSKYPTSSPTSISRSTLGVSPFVDANEDSVKQIRDDFDTKGKVKRFYVSLLERVDNFVWDPTVGSSTSGSNGIWRGFSVVLMICFAFFML